MRGLTLDFERHYFEAGMKTVMGVDEVGRGPLAGPVVVGAVKVTPRTIVIPGVIDSKLLSAAKRELLANLIKQSGLKWSVTKAGVGVINRLGINKAIYKAMVKATAMLGNSDLILIDGLYVPPNLKAKAMAVVKGDRKSYAIAAASILAKVYRDQLMIRLSLKYPRYTWERNKGYGTPQHIGSIQKYGVCIQHRKGFVDHLI